MFPQGLSTALVHLLEPLDRLRVRALIHILREANPRRGQRGPREDTTRASEDTLSILVRYNPPSLTSEQYEEADRLLRPESSLFPTASSTTCASGRRETCV